MCLCVNTNVVRSGFGDVVRQRVNTPCHFIVLPHLSPLLHIPQLLYFGPKQILCSYFPIFLVFSLCPLEFCRANHLSSSQGFICSKNFLQRLNSYFCILFSTSFIVSLHNRWPCFIISLSQFLLDLTICCLFSCSCSKLLLVVLGISCQQLWPFFVSSPDSCLIWLLFICKHLQDVSLRTVAWFSMIAHGRLTNGHCPNLIDQHKVVKLFIALLSPCNTRFLLFPVPPVWVSPLEDLYIIQRSWRPCQCAVMGHRSTTCCTLPPWHITPPATCHSTQGDIAFVIEAAKPWRHQHTQYWCFIPH